MNDYEIQKRRLLSAPDVISDLKRSKNFDPSNYTGSDAVYMIVGQKQPLYGRSAPDTYYFNTIRHIWFRKEDQGTQYDTYSEAEEDLWEAENTFCDKHLDKITYQLAVGIVSVKPRADDHKNLDMRRKSIFEEHNKKLELKYREDNMNIYEQLNKINDNESLSEKYNVKNAKELKKLKESASWSEKTYKFKYIPTDPEYYDIYGVELDMSDEEIDKAYETKGFPSLMWLDGEALITRNNDEDYGSYYEVSWTDDASDYIECSSVAECKTIVSNYYDGNVKWEAHDEEGLEESLKESDAQDNWTKLQKLMNDEPDSAPKTLDAAARAVDSKKLEKAAKQIIADLKRKGFDNSDIASIGSMVKATTDLGSSDPISNREKLIKTFPDLDI